MKTATLPAVRVAPELRAEIEGLLGETESLSQFVEDAVRSAVHQRREQSEFVARGLRSLAEARRTGVYFDTDEVVQRLQAKLAAARTPRASKAA